MTAVISLIKGELLSEVSGTASGENPNFPLVISCNKFDAYSGLLIRSSTSFG
ncbi:hypothetical protein HanPI659440_Chr09g0356371 [Helianthus annuus]|nr:hypothetical protein HanPI659440_Chr09g0356371 [Helianthus annuus]